MVVRALNDRTRELSREPVDWPARANSDRWSLGVALSGLELPQGSRAQRKPMFPVELSGVFEVRAATRYRLHQDR